MTTPLEQSIKEKIKKMALERDVTFSQLWRKLILERFLARLFQSDHRDKFILKGGTLLASYIPMAEKLPT